MTWDAHKWLSVPRGAGMFFCRHPEAVRGAFSVSTGYMPDETGQQPSPYRSTVQEVLDRIHERGEAWISSTVLREGRDPVLRACITSYRTNAGDVEHLVRELERTRTVLAA